MKHFAFRDGDPVESPLEYDVPQAGQHNPTIEAKRFALEFSVL